MMVLDSFIAKYKLVLWFFFPFTAHIQMFWMLLTLRDRNVSTSLLGCWHSQNDS